MTSPPVPIERVLHSIVIVRGQKVLLDSDLADLYGVETRVLNQAVKRNRSRFPRDFMFQLSADEWDNLKSQSVTSSQWGGRRKLPLAFTEQGVAMLSSILRSERAIEVNILIMRAFVSLRRFLATHEELALRLAALDTKVDERFKVVFDVLDKLIKAHDTDPRRIGFLVDSDEDDDR